jgi:hypothetical protein
MVHVFNVFKFFDLKHTGFTVHTLESSTDGKYMSWQQSVQGTYPWEEHEAGEGSCCLVG